MTRSARARSSSPSALATTAVVVAAAAATAATRTLLLFTHNVVSNLLLAECQSANAAVRQVRRGQFRHATTTHTPPPASPRRAPVGRKRLRVGQRVVVGDQMRQLAKRLEVLERPVVVVVAIVSARGLATRWRRDGDETRARTQHAPRHRAAPSQRAATKRRRRQIVDCTHGAARRAHLMQFQLKSSLRTPAACAPMSAGTAVRSCTRATYAHVCGHVWLRARAPRRRTGRCANGSPRDCATPDRRSRAGRRPATLRRRLPTPPCVLPPRAGRHRHRQSRAPEGRRRPTNRPSRASLSVGGAPRALL